jgi:molybdenum cofactor biosynthesis protein B
MTASATPTGDPGRSPVDEHKAHAPARVHCVVCTVSDSKTPETDTSGRLIRELIGAAGHEVVGYRLVRDEPSQVHAVIHEACTHPGVQAVIFTGGTGIAARDQTFEAIDALLEKRLPGFGELFRQLSYQEIGSAAMLSRALAGVRAGRVIFSLPGSPAACRLAVERLILPELSHIAGLLRR